MPFLLHGYHTPQLENIATPAIAFPLHNFKILPKGHMGFFWVNNPDLFFSEISRNYVSIIITIISNTTVLVSLNVIGFEYFLPISHAVNKKSPPIVSPAPPHYQVFTRFVCCFTRNTLSTWFCSGQIIGKNNTFSK